MATTLSSFIHSLDGDLPRYFYPILDRIGAGERLVLALPRQSGREYVKQAWALYRELKHRAGPRGGNSRQRRQRRREFNSLVLLKAGLVEGLGDVTSPSPPSRRESRSEESYRR